MQRLLHLGVRTRLQPGFRFLKVFLLFGTWPWLSCRAGAGPTMRLYKPLVNKINGRSLSSKGAFCIARPAGGRCTGLANAGQRRQGGRSGGPSRTPDRHRFCIILESRIKSASGPCAACASSSFFNSKKLHSAGALQSQGSSNNPRNSPPSTAGRCAIQSGESGCRPPATTRFSAATGSSSRWPRPCGWSG